MAATGGSVGWQRARRVAPHVLGIAWVVGAAVALLAPALAHGRVFGAYAMLGHDGLSSVQGTSMRVFGNKDLVDSLIPWDVLAWRDVHAGHLPLWNPFGGLGLPLAFNWQSGVFSLPALVGYAFPLRDVLTVQLVVDLVVAGVGGYVLGRVLGLGALGAATIGTVLELSGPVAAWLGYPFPAVIGEAGWILACGLLLLAGRRRRLAFVGLAVSTAFAFLGGQPEGATVLFLAVVLFFVVVLASRTRWLRGEGPVLRPAAWLAGGLAAGAGLAAPLVLPGLQTTSQSVRTGALGTHALSLHYLAYVVFQGYDGLPERGNLGFGLSWLFYSESAAYVGLGVVVLAAFALVARRRRPEVWALGAVVVACLAVLFVEPVTALAEAVPFAGKVDWLRAFMPLAFALAVLAGVGVDAVVRAADLRRTARGLGLAVAVGAVVLGLLFWASQGHLPTEPLTTEPMSHVVRDQAFVWPAVLVGVGLAAVVVLVVGGRAGPGRRARLAATAAGVVLLGGQTAFLLASGAPLVQSSAQGYRTSPSIARLQAVVGQARVGFGEPTCHLGFTPNVQDVYGVHELAVYDPIMPTSYFAEWGLSAGNPGGIAAANFFCPAVTSAAQARRFGIGYLLEPTGTAGPPGTVLVARLSGETLWRVPGAGVATLAPGSGPGGPGTPVAVRQPSPSRWRLTVDAAGPSVLRLHLTDVAGMRATLDGRPLALHRYDRMMLEADVPAGRHVVVVWYWPQLFTDGLVLAVVAALAVVAVVVVPEVRRRRRPVGDPTGAASAGRPGGGSGDGEAPTAAPEVVPAGVVPAGVGPAGVGPAGVGPAGAGPAGAGPSRPGGETEPPGGGAASVR